MTKDEVKALIESIGIIPGVRVRMPDLALYAAESLLEAGLPVVEITLTVPGAIGVISRLVLSHPQFVVGAGTVLDADMAHRCLDVGASFLTSPGFVPDVVEFALKNNVVNIPGALTPTEVIAAWKAGGDFIKIFPCAPMGGEKYIRTLKVPLPQIRLIASGGVNQQTASSFILAGANALGIGSELLPPEALELRHKHWINELARRFIAIVEEARAQKESRL